MLCQLSSHALPAPRRRTLIASLFGKQLVGPRVIKDNNGKMTAAKKDDNAVTMQQRVRNRAMEDGGTNNVSIKFGERVKSNMVEEVRVR
jgi:hypothetical protein